MSYMRHATSIVGYTYKADTWCNDSCVTDALGIGPLFADTPIEELLDKIAKERGIDRYDEYSYDSGDFPKVIFESQIEGPELCAGSEPGKPHWLGDYSPEQAGVDRCECGEWKSKEADNCGIGH